MSRVIRNPKGPHAPRRSDATNLILDAAIELVGELGVHGFSIAEVGARCGRPPAAIIHYYKNRVGLLVAVTNRLLRDRLKPLDQGHSLAAGLRAVAESVIQNPVRARAIATLECSRELPPKVQVLVNEARLAFEEALAGRIAGEPGRASDPDARAEAVCLACSLSGIVLSAQTPSELEACLGRLVAMSGRPTEATSTPVKKRPPGAAHLPSPPKSTQGSLFDL